VVRWQRLNPYVGYT